MGIRSGRGDKGLTDLCFRKRVSKDSVEISAIGDLDELISYLGLIRSKVSSPKDKTIIEKIQRGIAKIASEISLGPETKKKAGIFLEKADADRIKNLTYDLIKRSSIGSCFYLPGDNELSSFTDIARSVARRAERSVVSVFKKGKVKNGHILVYLNCVSDILFVMARKKVSRKRNPGRQQK